MAELIKYEVIDKFKIVDAFKPETILACVLEKDFTKTLLNALNRMTDLEKENAQLRSDLRIARIRLTKTEQKLGRFAEILQDNDSDAGDDGTPEKPKEKGKRVFKDKQCPGFGSTEPHMFTPTAGVQKMCPVCRAAYLASLHGGKPGRKKPELKTEHRGQYGVAGGNRQLTIDQVLDLPVAEQEVYWKKRWSPAEIQQARIIKNKREVEKMRAMRNKGFSLNDPIMGVNAPMPGK